MDLDSKKGVRRPRMFLTPFFAFVLCAGALALLYVPPIHRPSCTVTHSSHFFPSGIWILITNHHFCFITHIRVRIRVRCVVYAMQCTHVHVDVDADSILASISTPLVRTFFFLSVSEAGGVRFGLWGWCPIHTDGGIGCSAKAFVLSFC